MTFKAVKGGRIVVVVVGKKSEINTKDGSGKRERNAKNVITFWLEFGCAGSIYCLGCAL